MILIFFDYFSKFLATHFLEDKQGFSLVYPYGGIGVFQGFLGGIDFSLGYVKNPGAAFGILSSVPHLLFVLRSFLIIGLISWFYKKFAVIQFRFEWTLILAGAIGNWIDMAKSSAVIDFLNFHFYGYPFPLFNFADSFITIGAIFLLFKELFNQQKSKKS